MANDKCALGARNRADIENLKERVNRMDSKLNKILWLVIATLAGIVVQLIIRLNGQISG